MEKTFISEPNTNFDFKAEEKISIFVGAYGSGKSEVAVNFAIMLANRMNSGENRQSNDTYKKIVLADLDTINPYYRSTDAKSFLSHFNVEMIVPQYANTNIDVPAVPGEVFSVFDNQDIRAVLDIGGEDLGARVVSSLRSRIVESEHAVYMVVNLNRPFTDTEDKIIKMHDDIETSAGVKISGFVNNTNLLEFTYPDELLRANSILYDVTKAINKRVCFCAGMDDLFPREWDGQTPDHVQFLRLMRSIKYNENT